MSSFGTHNRYVYHIFRQVKDKHLTLPPKNIFTPVLSTKQILPFVLCHCVMKNNKRTALYIYWIYSLLLKIRSNETRFRSQVKVTNSSNDYQSSKTMFKTHQSLFYFASCLSRSPESYAPNETFLLFPFDSLRIFKMLIVILSPLWIHIIIINYVLINLFTHPLTSGS